MVTHTTFPVFTVHTEAACHVTHTYRICIRRGTWRQMPTLS